MRRDRKGFIHAAVRGKGQYLYGAKRIIREQRFGEETRAGKQGSNCSSRLPPAASPGHAQKECGVQIIERAVGTRVNHLGQTLPRRGAERRRQQYFLQSTWQPPPGNPARAFPALKLGARARPPRPRSGRSFRRARCSRRRSSAADIRGGSRAFRVFLHLLQAPSAQPLQ